MTNRERDPNKDKQKEIKTNIVRNQLKQTFTDRERQSKAEIDRDIQIKAEGQTGKDTLREPYID